MTSRERVLMAIAHREPDRVPIDLGSTPSSGISAIAYNRLKAHIGIDPGLTKVYDVVQQVAQPDEEILSRYRVDVLDLGRMFSQHPDCWRPVTLTDASAAAWPSWFITRARADGGLSALLPDGQEAGRMPSGGMFFEQTIFPYEGGYPDNYRALGADMAKVAWSAFAHSPWDVSALPGFYQKLREAALTLRAESSRAIMLVCGCNLFEWGTFLRRIDQFLIDLVDAPAEVERLLDALLEKHLDTLARVCDAVGDIVDIIRFGDDLGMDSGTFFSPAIYRRLFKPRHAQLCGYVKRNSQMKTFLHSCGSIYALMPDLIEAGYDIINPVQTTCRDMEPARLKREFGTDITFWGGGADTRRLLNTGTPEEVRTHVLEHLHIFAPGGGYVFGAIHNILPDVPPENIEAMFAAVEEFSA